MASSALIWAPDPNCRRIMLKSLQNRNARECSLFSDMIASHGHLLENADSLKSENLQLSLQNEYLRKENTALQLNATAGDAAKSSEKQSMMEQKMYSMQEELTELHRRKGENAQQYIDMKKALEVAEKHLSEERATNDGLQGRIKILRDTLQNRETQIKELESTIQMIRDEHQALQMAYSSLSDQLRKAEEDFNEVLVRWMAEKTQYAEKLNVENEEMVRRRQAKMKKELEDAVSEAVIVPLPDMADDCMRPILSSVSVPTTCICSLDVHEGEVNAIRWSPRGRTIATGGADRKVKLWEATKSGLEQKGVLTGSNAAIMGIDIDASEELVLASSYDFASRLWTISDRRLRHTLTGHSGRVTAAKFLGDSKRVVSGSNDRTLKIWDLRSQACVRTIFAGSSCHDVAADNAGSAIISGHFDKKIRFWDTRNENSTHEVLLQGRVTSLDLSPDGTQLLSCVRDETLRLLDLRQNQITRTFSADGFKVGSDFTRAIFSPGGHFVAAGSANGPVYVWNSSDGKIEAVLKEHPATVLACAWQPEGNYLATCDRNKKVVLWADINML